MAIFKCGSCGYERIVPDRLVGKKAKCPDCSVGVTIAEELDKDAIPDPGVSEEVAVPPDQESSAEERDGVPIAALDLDNLDVEADLDEPDDIICSSCGYVLAAGHTATCPKCQSQLGIAETIPEIDEADVDVSDMAGGDAPKVWDEDFSSEDGDSEVLTGPSRPGGWRFMQGPFLLNIYAGVISGGLALFLVYALSLLVVSRFGLHDYLPYVLGAVLTSVLVGSVVNSLFSRIPVNMVGPETVVTGVLFVFVGNIYQSMADVYDPDFILPTILAGVAIAAFATGLSLYLLGQLRLGEFVRYVPLQIIGGVLGGVGFFVLLGAFDGMLQLHLDWSNSYTIVSSFAHNFNALEALRAAGPSLAFGLVVFLAMYRSKNSVFLLFLVLAACGVGIGAGTWGTTNAILSLAAPVTFPEGPMLNHPAEVLYSWLLVKNIQWGLIESNGLYIGALTVLSVLTVMYRTTKLEILRGRESDLNVEYRALGMTNMVLGMSGGMPVSLSYSRSMGAYAAGGRGPLTGIVMGFVCAAGLFYADIVLPMIPRFVPEGLLIYVCLGLIHAWVFRTKTAFTSRYEKWLLRLTFLVTISLGLLVGIGFGVALALMVTVSRTSRGGVVRNVLTGSNHSSNVDRAPAQIRTLKEFGDHIHILRLQGFLFLGSMEQLIKEIHIRLVDRNKLPMEYLILDFSLVNGFAAAASIGFDKLRTLVWEHDFECVITNAPLELEEHLETMGHVGEDHGLFKVFFNLDYAMEWCEQRVLDSENMLVMKEHSLAELLAPVFPEPKYIPALLKVLRRETAKSGEMVFRQGDRSDSMFFVESGKLDVELEMEDGKILRLKKVGPGAVFGEMGIYTLAPRSATIRAAEDCVLYRMTLDKLDAIEKRAPMLVTAVNRFLINLLSERLADANAKVRDLLM